jgi:hypothetical protein
MEDSTQPANLQQTSVDNSGDQPVITPAEPVTPAQPSHAQVFVENQGSNISANDASQQAAIYQASGTPPQVSPNNQPRTLLFGLITVSVLLVIVSVLGLMQHNKATSLTSQINGLKKQTVVQDPNNATSNATSSEGSQSEYARDTKRQVDLISLQTQLEAFYSQQGYYPNLTDMNSASWRATHLQNLDPTALADPLSTCNPDTTACLVTKPTAKAYAYEVADAKGSSCESNDTVCAQYTLIATFEGTSHGSKTYIKNNLD